MLNNNNRNSTSFDNYLPTSTPPHKTQQNQIIIVTVYAQLIFGKPVIAEIFQLVNIGTIFTAIKSFKVSDINFPFLKLLLFLTKYKQYKYTEVYLYDIMYLSCNSKHQNTQSKNYYKGFFC